MRHLYHLLIFVGLVLHVDVQCQTICRKNQYTVFKPDGSKSCLNCDTCHPGRGLYPRCGSHIPYPPKIDCVTCRAEEFSDKLDSAPCHSCQRCAEHEIVTAPCTIQSNRICNGTCEVGYFYSKEDSTHSCKKCSYCCLDGNDEKITECVSQGLEASKQHCHPRPDKDCNPGSFSSTTQKTGTDASTNGSSITGVVIGGVFGGVGFIVMVGFAFYLCRLRRKKALEVSHVQQSLNVEEGNGKASFTSQYASEGPQIATVTTNTQVRFTEPANANMNPEVSLELEKSTPEEKSGETAVANTANQADGKTEKSPDVKMSGKPSLSRQSSRDSQISGDGETRFRRRSNSAITFEKLTRKLSERDGSLLEEELTEEIHEAIKITEEPSSQKVKEGSKVELVFKCKARGKSKLAYQWYKDGTELQGRDEGTLPIKSVTLPDFGWYKCVACCKDSPSDSVKSSLAELNVTPRDGTVYKYLRDIDLDTQDRLERLLTRRSSILAGWRQIAFKYGMDQLRIESLENDPEAGKRTLEYIRSTNPDLTVYNFCKTLKEDNIRRLEIVNELRGHLSVPSSSKVSV